MVVIVIRLSVQDALCCFIIFCIETCLLRMALLCLFGYHMVCCVLIDGFKTFSLPTSSTSLTFRNKPKNYRSHLFRVLDGKSF